MKVIRARNVQQALPEALYQLEMEGVQQGSRNGPVYRFREPVTTVYLRPTERVLFWPTRDANPFFHLIESLWMLAGRNDVELVAQFVARMRSFSDDGTTLHGAYGYRWREHFGFDQLQLIIDALRKDPTDRRQVLSMWDARADLGRSGKDLPCNTQCLFQINPDGALDMTVVNRSNDIIMGAYGANAVHFSYLQEYMALSIGVPVGVYRQVSANFHAYVADFEKVHDLAHVVDEVLPPEMRWSGYDPYGDGVVEPYPLIQTDLAQWNEDLRMFLQTPKIIGLRDPFFRKVAVPMWAAHGCYKALQGQARFDAARELLQSVAATDWRMAALEWIDRREEKWKRANDDGARSAE